jgi:hypothetical protein
MKQDIAMGLPEAGWRFLDANEQPLPHRLELIGRYNGTLGHVYPLYRHQLKDGRYADAWLQRKVLTPRGQIFFLALWVYDQDGNITDEFKWSTEEIENA